MVLDRFRKSNTEIHIPPDEAPNGLSWQAMADLSRDVVASRIANELPHFDAVLADFRKDPKKTVKAQSLKAPVGVGVDLALLTPYLLAILSFLFGLVAEAAAEQAAKAIGQSTRERLSGLLRRRRQGPKAVAEPLTPDQEREVAEVLRVRAEGLGLNPERARQLAEIVIGALRLRDDTVG
jgi:hypothetical protein